MHNKISLEIAKKFGIEDIIYGNKTYRDTLYKLRGKYIDTDPTYATMVDNMDLLYKEGDKRFISEYLNIIEYLFTSDKISEQDKIVFVSYFYHNTFVFALHSFIAPNNRTIIPYKDYDDSIIGQYINKWKSSDNKYLRSIIVYELISGFNIWKYKPFNTDIDQVLIKIRDTNIETIAKSISEEYYKPIMVNILHQYCNFISFTEDEALIKAIKDDCEYLIVYNEDSNDIYDVLIRANAYRLMRFKFYTAYKAYIEDKTEKDIPTYLYMYIEENVFYECEISDSAVCKKLDNGGYLTSGYCIDSMGYEKEWFKNNPDCDCIYIDETPEFYEPINIPQFDITFNSDPNLFEDAIILYASREEAKKAFLERNK